MSVYLLNLGFVYFCSYFARFYSRKDTLLSSENKPDATMMFFSLLSLVIVSGLRYRVGTDYLNYVDIYYMAGLYNNIWDIDLTASPDIGFTILLWLLHQISDDPQIMFIVTALITNFFIVKTLSDYAKPFELGMFLYICSFSYYGTFNGVRQYLASAIIFWSVRYIIRGNWIKYFSIILLVSTVHASALIMIPVYFLVRKKAWSPIFGLVTFLFIIITILYITLLPTIVSVLSNTPYGHYEQWLTTSNNGMNSIKIVVMILPLIIAYIYRDIMRELWPDSDPIINLSLIGFMFGLLAMRDVIFARFLMYFGLYQLLIIPYFTRLFVQKENTFIYYLVIVFYFLYSYLLLPVDSNMLPYKMIFFK